MNQTAKTWKVKEVRQGPKLPLFEVEIKTFVNPRNDVEVEALRLHLRDTVNIICVTNQDELVLIEQFRFGVEEDFVELPAGLIDEGETPMEAARRELLEETGYSSDDWELLGTSFINPSYVDNTCHHFIARSSVSMKAPAPEQSEDIRVCKYPMSKWKQLVLKGPIRDAMTRAAFSLYALRNEQLCHRLH